MWKTVPCDNLAAINAKGLWEYIELRIKVGHGAVTNPAQKFWGGEWTKKWLMVKAKNNNKNDNFDSKRKILT